MVWVQMNRGNLAVLCQGKGIIRIHRFHFDHDECSADAAILSGLQGECGLIFGPAEVFQVCKLKVFFFFFLVRTLS